MRNFYMTDGREKMFEKSPQVTPLLVRLYDSHKLYRQVKDQQPHAKVELATAVADLLEMELNAREQELIADVLIGLIRQAEYDLRIALSERLSTLDNAPLRLILFLANNEDIKIATPVLQSSAVLSDVDLIYIIKSRGTSYWQAIAARENLSDEIINALAETRDNDMAVVLSRNERIVLTEYAMSILVEMAEDSDWLAKSLLARPELPERLVRSLYKQAGYELKAYIRSYFGNLGEEAEQAIDDLILEFVDHAETPEKKAEPEYMPTEAMIKAAEKYGELGMLNAQLMMEVLERGQIAQFIALFSRYSGLSAKNVHDTLKLAKPKSLAIACRAYGIQKSDFSRIYLMTNKMRSSGKVVNHAHMLDMLEYFDKVRPESARRIISSSNQ